MSKPINGKLVPFFLGVLAGGILVSAIASYLNQPIDQLRYYATALVGLFGIGVGLVTYAHHVRQAESTRSWKVTRSRVILAVELSVLIGYAEDSMRVAYAYLDEIKKAAGAQPSASLPDAPRLPDKSIDRLAEAAADLEIEEIGDLLRNYQIQHSRLAGMVDDYKRQSSSIVTPSNCRTYLRDAARLFKLAERQFGLARGEWEFRDKSVSDEEIRKSLDFRGFLDD